MRPCKIELHAAAVSVDNCAVDCDAIVRESLEDLAVETLDLLVAGACHPHRNVFNDCVGCVQSPNSPEILHVHEVNPGLDQRHVEVRQGFSPEFCRLQFNALLLGSSFVDLDRVARRIATALLTPVRRIPE